MHMFVIGIMGALRLFLSVYRDNNVIAGRLTVALHNCSVTVAHSSLVCYLLYYGSTLFLFSSTVSSQSAVFGKLLKSIYLVTMLSMLTQFHRIS